MNTKTMRLPPRRVLTSDKRVLTGALAGKPTETAVTNPPPPPIKSILKKTPPFAPSTATTAVAEPGGSNELLAGYLAHEFLNKGTLFGEQWNPARAQAGPFSAQSSEPRKNKPSDNNSIEPNEHKRRRYVEVANILRVDGAHLPGIVNPTQLARSLKL